MDFFIQRYIKFFSINYIVLYSHFFYTKQMISFYDVKKQISQKYSVPYYLLLAKVRKIVIFLS